MKRGARACLLSGLALALACGIHAIRADTVTLNDGTTVEGVIVIQTATKLVVRQGGTSRIIRMDDVKSIARAERSDSGPTPPPARGFPFQAATPAYAAPSLEDPVSNSTVKIFSTISVPDPRKPWAKLPPREESGSGFVIPLKRILTSAHVVEYATDIQVRGNKAGDKIPARVIALDESLDLAVLKLDDESFFDSHAALTPVGSIPATSDSFKVYGYTGDSSDVTVFHPTVTTVDFAPYDDEASGIIVRLNSEQPASVSGGPVTDYQHGNGNVEGMICCRRRGGRDHSFVIPTMEIREFLQSDGFMTKSKGPFPGKAMILDQVQNLENPALREYLGLGPGAHGVVISKSSANSEHGFLDWDVLTTIRDVQIDDQGTVPFAGSLRVNFAQKFQERADASDIVRVCVLRERSSLFLDIPVVRKRKMLIPSLEGSAPSYFVFGPIVFSAVTSQVTALISQSEELELFLSARGSPLVTRRSETPAFPGEQLVCVPAPFFPHRLATGYSDPSFSVVKAINGIPIRNLKHLVQVLRDSKDEFVTVEFVDKNTEIIVFPRAEMIAATDGILGDNNVRNQGSEDAMAVWNAK